MKAFLTLISLLSVIGATRTAGLTPAESTDLQNYLILYGRCLVMLGKVSLLTAIYLLLTGCFEIFSPMDRLTAGLGLLSSLSFILALSATQRNRLSAMPLDFRVKLPSIELRVVFWSIVFLLLWIPAKLLSHLGIPLGKRIVKAERDLHRLPLRELLKLGPARASDSQ